MTPAQEDRALEALVGYLKRRRVFDFTGYKRASLARRIAARIQALGIDGYGRYVGYLERHPEEFPILLHSILVSVTRFFRDRAAWQVLRGQALPDLLAHKHPTAPICIWSAGCASGEEAYTLAIVLAELLGVESFRDRVTIYATDIDEEALARARRAAYNEAELADVPPRILATYFDRIGDTYAFSRELRSQVVFGRHDLIQDAPILKADVLACRNVLMYFNAETQAHILSGFRGALTEHGILFLGRAETMLAPPRTTRQVGAAYPTHTIQ